MKVTWQWWEIEKLKFCGERFCREGSEGKVCMERLDSREEVLLLEVVEEGAEEELIELSYAWSWCFCLGSEIVEW